MARYLVLLKSLKVITGFLVALATVSQSALAGPPPSVDYIRPNVDFKKYTQFIIKPLGVDNSKIIPPPWAENPQSHQWKMTDENRAYLKKIYMESIVDSIHAGGQFNVVKNPSAATLEVKVNIISVTPYSKRGEKVITRGSGKLVMEAQLRDAQTGELLVIIQEDQSVGEDFQENTVLTHQHNLKEHFSSWGRRLNKTLADIHKGRAEIGAK